MTISKGLSVKKLTLYPPTQPVEEKVMWVEDPCSNNELIHLLVTIAHSIKFKEETIENQVNYDINHLENSKNIKNAELQLTLQDQTSIKIYHWKIFSCDLYKRIFNLILYVYVSYKHNF